MKITGSSLIGVIFLCLISSVAVGQTNSMLHWYFSQNNNGIFFDQNTLDPRLENVPRSLNIGQSAVASNIVTGELIFYTDGQQVYDKYHRAVTNGSGLLANPAGPQAVAVSHVPGTANQGRYYIFTNSADLTSAGNIRYSVYDTAFYGAGGFPEPPVGDIDPAEKNQTIADLPDGSLSPAMLIVPNSTFDGFWIITHERGTENYMVTEIQADGSIGTTTPYNIPGAPQIAHTITYSDSSAVFPGTPTLSIAPQDNRSVTLVSFDPSTGAIDEGNPQFIPNTSTSQLSNINVFDTEFSPTGRFLYISGNFDSTVDSLMQVDLEDPTFPMVSLNTQRSLTRSYGLQKGPDDLIYHLYETDEYHLGRINEPDSIGSLSFYSRTAVGNNIFRSQQFAAFLPLIDPVLELDFEIAGRCANAPVLFFPTIKPSADSVNWSFGDGGGSDAYAPRYTYSDGGNFSVSLIAYSNGFGDTLTKEVVIQQFDLSLSGFPSDTTICPEDFPITLTAEASGEDAEGAIFRWSNMSENGATTTIDSAGNYYVVASANGCSAYLSISVEEYGSLDQRANVWFFGEHAGIDFNPIVFDPPGDPVPIPYGDPTIYNGGNEMVAPEGCAIYCDPNGFPIVYSDGTNVYDREGTLVATLSGDQDATQSIMIVQDPSDVTLYYFFTTEAIEFSGGNIFTLKYSVFDLKLRNGLGDIVRDQANQPIEEVLMSNSTEKITGDRNWVIAHEYGNNLFRAYQLTGNGIAAPVISQIGSVHPSSIAVAGTGYMKLSNTSSIAVALPLGGTNYIELFDFVDSSGVVTNFRQMDVNADFNVTGNIYGVEFSGDSRRIFGSLLGGSQSHIVEYWLDSLDNPVPQDQFDTNLEIGALQVGPDGQIYVASNNQQFLGIINAAGGDSSVVSQYQESGFGLSPGTLSRLGLPNFDSRSGPQGGAPNLTAGDGCPGDEITFISRGTSDRDQFIFNVIRLSDNVEVDRSQTYGPDPTETVSHTFSTTTPGQYEVSVFIFNDCDNSPDTTLTTTFTVFSPPPFDLVNISDATACNSSDGSLQININFGGTYHYFIRNTNGEIIDAGFDVDDQVLTMDSLPGDVYTVFIEEQTNGCTNSQNITINENPPFTLSAFPETADCEGLNGEIRFTTNSGNATPTPPLTYTLTDQSTSNNILNGTTNQFDTTLLNINAGTYILTVDDANNCSDFVTDIEVMRPDTVTLRTDPFVSACGVQEIIIGAQSPNAQGITWTYGNNTSDTDSITVFEPGLYTVTAEGDGVNNCDNQKDVIVTFSTESPNPFREQYSICPEDPIVENSVVKLYPGANFIQSEYFTEDDELITATTPGFDFSGDTLLVYTLANIRAELTNQFGCVTEAEVTILESCEARISIPNAFRPSSSTDINTTFRIYPTFLDEDNFQIIIFNRWGEIVFESKDPNFRWNGGKLNDPSQPLPQGTYAYVIRFISRFTPELGVQTERGAVVLLR